MGALGTYYLDPRKVFMWGSRGGCKTSAEAESWRKVEEGGTAHTQQYVLRAVGLQTMEVYHGRRQNTVADLVATIPN